MQHSAKMIALSAYTRDRNVSYRNLNLINGYSRRYLDKQLAIIDLIQIIENYVEDHHNFHLYNSFSANRNLLIYDIIFNTPALKDAKLQELKSNTLSTGEKILYLFNINDNNIKCPHWKGQVFDLVMVSPDKEKIFLTSSVVPKENNEYFLPRYGWFDWNNEHLRYIDAKTWIKLNSLGVDTYLNTEYTCRDEHCILILDTFYCDANGIHPSINVRKEKIVNNRPVKIQYHLYKKPVEIPQVAQIGDLDSKLRMVIDFEKICCKLMNSSGKYVSSIGIIGYSSETTGNGDTFSYDNQVTKLMTKFNKEKTLTGVWMMTGGCTANAESSTKLPQIIERTPSETELEKSANIDTCIIDCNFQDIWQKYANMDKLGETNDKNDQDDYKYRNWKQCVVTINPMKNNTDDDNTNDNDIDSIDRDYQFTFQVDAIKVKNNEKNKTDKINIVKSFKIRKNFRYIIFAKCNKCQCIKRETDDTADIGMLLHVKRN